MQKRINCIIVDDEPLARLGMEHYTRETGFLNVVASCDTAVAAVDAIGSQSVELMFLDIQMPDITGIELLRTVRNLPATVIISAYPQYALTAFELDVIDYIIKPFPFERFLKAAVKAREYISLRDRSQMDSPAPEEFFFVKCDQVYEKVFFDEIVFIEASKNYVTIKTEKRKLLSYLTIKAVEDYLPKEKFLRINRFHIVPVSRIDSVEGNQIKIAEHSFLIGRLNREEILQQIFGKRILKRKP